MSEKSVKVRYTLEPEAADLPPPAPATVGSAGADLRAAIVGGADAEPITLAPGEFRMISTGIRFEIPHGYEIQVRPRSGLAARHGVTLLNSPGTIDSDYRGVVHAVMINHGPEPFTIRHGDRIAQIVLAPVTELQLELSKHGDLSETERGSGGFGHTGVK